MRNITAKNTTRVVIVLTSLFLSLYLYSLTPYPVAHPLYGHTCIIRKDDVYVLHTHMHCIRIVCAYIHAPCCYTYTMYVHVYMPMYTDRVPTLVGRYPYPMPMPCCMPDHSTFLPYALLSSIGVVLCRVAHYDKRHGHDHTRYECHHSLGFSLSCCPTYPLP